MHYIHRAVSHSGWLFLFALSITRRGSGVVLWRPTLPTEMFYVTSTVLLIHRIKHWPDDQTLRQLHLRSLWQLHECLVRCSSVCVPLLHHLSMSFPSGVRCYIVSVHTLISFLLVALIQFECRTKWYRNTCFYVWVCVLLDLLTTLLKVGPT